ENQFPWRKASKYCRNASMVAITNQKENDHLDERLPYVKGYYWTSGIHNGSGWIWTSTQELMHFTNWAKDEPNNLTTRENCIEIYIKSEASSGQWNDDNCRKRKRALCYKASCSNSSCFGHGVCLETIGNYTCKCEDGFTGARCENGKRVRFLYNFKNHRHYRILFLLYYWSELSLYVYYILDKDIKKDNYDGQIDNIGI
uniref:Uncharacterized protein n=1 Tax=Eptatretus burgeri TaxID=7764 RepID=A0A8C4QTC8_EPTBU